MKSLVQAGKKSEFETFSVLFWQKGLHPVGNFGLAAGLCDPDVLLPKFDGQTRISGISRAKCNFGKFLHYSITTCLSRGKHTWALVIKQWLTLQSSWRYCIFAVQNKVCKNPPHISPPLMHGWRLSYKLLDNLTFLQPSSFSCGNGEFLPSNDKLRFKNRKHCSWHLLQLLHPWMIKFHLERIASLDKATFDGILSMHSLKTTTSAFS